MANALRFRNPKLPRQNGELARLKVVQGPDYGSVFVLTGASAAVGRGEDTDVMIADLKASRRHAELRFDGFQWAVVDLGSANGILVNGKQVPTAKLKTGDTITLGESTFEFVMSNVGTQMLVAPPKSAGEVQAGL